MDYRYEIPTYSNKDDGIVNVVIEIPKGTTCKYEIDEETGNKLTIVRDLHKKYRYPFNYGFIANTMADDHDQLDAVVISDEAIVPLTVIPCRVIGVVKTIDNGEQDDKILCVPNYSTKKSADLGKIIKYLKNYKYPDQAGTIIQDILDRTAALDVIESCRLCMNNPTNN